MGVLHVHRLLQLGVGVGDVIQNIPVCLGAGIPTDVD